MQRITILGSTGSIGVNTLRVIRENPQMFRVAGISGNRNIDLLYKQVQEFHPEAVCVYDKDAALRLKPKLAGRKVRLLTADEGIMQLASSDTADKVVMAIAGAGALLPLLKAIESGKSIALANKEALVMAGPIIMDRAAKNKVKIIPIDSEQSAIWQCLAGQDKAKLRSIYLTASGGPFRNTRSKDLKDVASAQVLRHPTWRMGKKITVDSATLMNKGLEVIEAMFLFNVALPKIKVIIHPESIIHSMVEFVDRVILAQLSVADMRIPIQYALSYPDRLENNLRGVDFFRLQTLNFSAPDFKRFPCLRLAYEAASRGGSALAVLNAANELSVESFLRNKILFSSIPKVIEKVLEKHSNNSSPDLEDIRQADIWAREEACKVINSKHKAQMAKYVQSTNLKIPNV
jgi:1-deoxy-D-xylulose-5-phosphate reductoisomerase